MSETQLVGRLLDDRHDRLPAEGHSVEIAPINVTGERENKHAPDIRKSTVGGKLHSPSDQLQWLHHPQVLQRGLAGNSWTHPIHPIIEPSTIYLSSYPTLADSHLALATQIDKKPVPESGPISFTDGQRQLTSSWPTLDPSHTPP